MRSKVQPNLTNKTEECSIHILELLSLLRTIALSKQMCNSKQSGLPFNGKVEGIGESGCHLPDYS